MVADYNFVTYQFPKAFQNPYIYVLPTQLLGGDELLQTLTQRDKHNCVLFHPVCHQPAWLRCQSPGISELEWVLWPHSARPPCFLHLWLLSFHFSRATPHCSAQRRATGSLDHLPPSVFPNFFLPSPQAFLISWYQLRMWQLR